MSMLETGKEDYYGAPAITGEYYYLYLSLLYGVHSWCIYTFIEYKQNWYNSNTLT